jgi:hypothetical protein
MQLLSSIVQLWIKQIRLAEKSKEKLFGKTAKRCWQFLGQDYNSLYVDQDGEESFPHGSHRVRRNLTAEYLAVMLPHIHHKVPHRLVNPDVPAIPTDILGLPPGVMLPPNPAAQQSKLRAWMMQWLLNYTPKQYDLRGESRKVASEALVKGRGVMWHEMYEGYSGFIPGSFYDSVDGLLIDPDAEQWREAAYIVRKRRMSVWRLAEIWNRKPEEIKGKYRSNLETAADEVLTEGSGLPNDDTSLDRNDVVDVYYVYSRMGIGQKFQRASSDMRDGEAALANLGDFIFLVIVPGMEYPLNLPPEVIDEAEINARLAWPMPFHQIYHNPWPCTPFDFYANERDPWARSPLEASLPLQSFLDHAYGYLMSRVRTTCRDLIVTSTSLQEAFSKALESGLDQEIIKVDGNIGTAIRQLFEVVQFPPINTDIWTIIQMVERAFEKSAGYDSLFAGGQGATQIRSSAEVQIRNEHLMNRPEDMAECMERFQSDVARAEGFMARMGVAPQTVAPLFGEQVIETVMGPQMGVLTQAWGQLVNTQDPRIAASEMEYTIEAGSGRRKNKQKQQADVQMLMQTMFPTMVQTGNVDSANAMIDFMADAFDMDLTKMHLQPPPPPMMPPQGGPPPQGVPQ